LLEDHRPGIAPGQFIGRGQPSRAAADDNKLPLLPITLVTIVHKLLVLGSFVVAVPATSLVFGPRQPANGRTAGPQSAPRPLPEPARPASAGSSGGNAAPESPGRGRWPAYRWPVGDDIRPGQPTDRAGS